jgi:hypothetical protein
VVLGVGGAVWYHFGKKGLQASQNAITEILGRIFGEMRRHLTSQLQASWIMTFSGDNATQEQNHAGLALDICSAESAGEREGMRVGVCGCVLPLVMRHFATWRMPGRVW